MNHLCIFFCSIFGFAISLQNISYSQIKPKYKVVTSYWAGKNAEQIALSLEKRKKQIEYCLSNIGRKFTEVDIEQIGEDSRSLYDTIGVITYGLIAYKNLNPAVSAEYFYKDWVEFEKCEQKRYQGTRKEGCFTFGVGPGDYNPLASAIGQWKYAGMYNEALKHYDEYFDDTFLLRPEKATRKEKLQFLKTELKSDVELKKEYTDFMREWDRTKQLAKTEKPKPLSIQVQVHEWFYSDKQEEVLKALEYYYTNKVKFMLEKAVNRKDPLIAAKVKEYLEKLSQGKEECVWGTLLKRLNVI